MVTMSDHPAHVGSAAFQPLDDLSVGLEALTCESLGVMISIGGAHNQLFGKKGRPVHASGDARHTHQDNLASLASKVQGVIQGSAAADAFEDAIHTADHNRLTNGGVEQASA